jgi:hypothetical protein
MSMAFASRSCGPERQVEQPGAEKIPPRPACGRRLRRRVAAALVLCAGGLAMAGLRSAWGQDGAPKQGDTDAPARWTILFRADNPALWNTRAKGKAIPLTQAPAKVRYLRLRRMDTGEALILPITRELLWNGTPKTPDVGHWWNGTAKLDWKGRHLGIAQAPRHKFPAPHGMIAVMTENWDAWTGSGFGNKAFVNDGQYYCWRGTEIPRTAFEIAVSEGPLSKAERRSLVRQR